MLDVIRDSPPVPGVAPLSRQADATLTDQLAARFAERIRARLPSVR